MLYPVKEVSEMSGVSIKTLHHYHKIGLLLPHQITEAGYRLYGTKELERLQEILFFKELDFSLEQIQKILEQQSDRLAILLQQEALIVNRKHRLDAIVQTLRKSIASIQGRRTMDNKELFQGFANEEEWNQALDKQNRYLEEAYRMEPLKVSPDDVERLNDQAAEAAAFMDQMAGSLKAGIRHNDGQINSLIRCHLAFMNKHGHQLSAQDFADQAKFFLNDDFHFKMLEGQQIGLAYYLAAAADSFAAAER